MLGLHLQRHSFDRPLDLPPLLDEGLVVGEMRSQSQQTRPRFLDVVDYAFLQTRFHVLPLHQGDRLLEVSVLLGRDARVEIIGSRVPPELLEYGYFGFLDIFGLLVVVFQFEELLPPAPQVGHQGPLEQEAASHLVVEGNALVDEGGEDVSHRHYFRLGVVGDSEGFEHVLLLIVGEVLHAGLGFEPLHADVRWPPANVLHVREHQLHITEVLAFALPPALQQHLHPRFFGELPGDLPHLVSNRLKVAPRVGDLEDVGCQAAERSSIEEWVIDHGIGRPGASQMPAMILDQPL